MVVVFHTFGDVEHYTAKTAVGFIVHSISELTRLGISESLGAYFFSEHLKRERGNAGAFCFLVYCLTVSLVLGAFQSSFIGEAFAAGLIISFLPSISVHLSMCYVNPSWRSCRILGDIIGTMIPFGLTMAAQQSVSE